MNKSARTTLAYFLLYLISLGTSVTLRTIACLNDLNSFGKFEPEWMINIAGTVAAAGAIALFVLVMITMSTRKPSMSFSSPSCYIPSGIVGAALIFLAYSIISGSYGDIIKPAGSGSLAQLTVSILPALLVILTMLSAIHFFLNTFLTDKANETRAYFAIATVLLLALFAIELYFDTSLPLNAHNKIIDQMAYVFAAIFFLYETRISLGRDKWRRYAAFGFSAGLLCGYSAIPTLITYFVREDIISRSAVDQSVFLLTVFIFITARMLTMALSPEEYDKNSGALAIIGDYAVDRARFVDAETARYAEKYAVQLTIDDVTSESISPLGDIPELDEEDDCYSTSEADALESAGIEEFFAEEIFHSADQDEQVQLELPTEIFDEAAAQNLINDAARHREESAEDINSDRSEDTEN